jgi:hypothetical protein
VSPTKRLIVAEPGKVIVGGKSKLTITVLDTEAILPSASETEYTIVYVPSVAVLTVPEDVREEVKSPSILSEAVAPGSVNVLPNSIFIIDSQTREIPGGKEVSVSSL